MANSLAAAIASFKTALRYLDDGILLVSHGICSRAMRSLGRCNFCCKLHPLDRLCPPPYVDCACEQMHACSKLQQIHGTTPEQGFAGTFVGPGYTEGNALTGDAKAFCNLLISTGIGSQVSPSSNCNSTHTAMSVVHMAEHTVRWTSKCLAELLIMYATLHCSRHSQQP